MYTLSVYLNGSLWCSSVAPVIGNHVYSVLVTLRDWKLWCSHMVTFARQCHEVKEKSTKSMEKCQVTQWLLHICLCWWDWFSGIPCPWDLWESPDQGKLSGEESGYRAFRLMGPQRKYPKVLRELADGIVRQILFIFERPCQLQEVPHHRKKKKKKKKLLLFSRRTRRRIEELQAGQPYLKA